VWKRKEIDNHAVTSLQEEKKRSKPVPSFT